MRQLTQFVVRQVNKHQRITAFGIIVVCVVAVAQAFRDDSQCPA